VDSAPQANDQRQPSWEEIVAGCKADPDHCRAAPKSAPEGEVKEEGTAGKIIQAALEIRRKLRKYGEDAGEAATRGLIRPKERDTAAHERAQRSALDYDPHVNIAERAGEVVTDIGREGGGQLGEQAFDAAAAKGASMAAGGILQAAGKGRQVLQALARESDEVIEAAEAEAKAVSKATSGVRYGPLKPGPLPEKIAQTFRGGSYTASTVSEPITLYRVYGGKAGQLGPYWTRTRPSGPLQARIDLALRPEWGNTATQVVKIEVPAGTKIYEGFVEAQGGLVGGGSQVVIPKVDPRWVIH
jgi:hypothetical protein